MLTRVWAGLSIAGLVAVGFFAPVRGDEVAAPAGTVAAKRRLSHEETLRWIAEHRAWRVARKTKPIWVRAVTVEEVGKPFRTADHTTETAQAGFLLCVGVAGEPWFQKPEKMTAKYKRVGPETRRFAFDDHERKYERYQPRESSRNWAARVEAPGIEGFYIQPNYPTDGPLYSPNGGYVVKDFVDDPYTGNPNDVWLVQQSLFESTYEIQP